MRRRRRMGYGHMNVARKMINLESIPGDDFPLQSRLIAYAKSLVPMEDHTNATFLNFVFSVFPKHEMLSFIDQFAVRCPQEVCAAVLSEDLSKVEDVEDMATVFSRILSRSDMAGVIPDFQWLLDLFLTSFVIPDAVSYKNRMMQLCKKLGLGPDEVAVLEWCCCAQLSPELDQVMDLYGVTQKSGIMSIQLGLPLARFREVVAPKGLLVRNDLISLDSSGAQVDAEIMDFLLGNAGDDFAVDAFKFVESASLSLEEFSIGSSKKVALEQIVRSEGAANLLFYGKPGTGKTELSKTIPLHCNCPAVVVSCGEHGERYDRKKALLTTVNSVPAGTVIIVDEADSLLAAQDTFRRVGPNKAWMNQFMDSNRHKIIWIVNDIGSLEESVRRRFAFSIRFDGLGVQQRVNIWDFQLRAQRIKRFFPNEKIDELANQYAVSPGIITYAVRMVAQCVQKGWSSRQVHALLSEVLEAQLVLDGRSVMKHADYRAKMMNPLAGQFDQSVLHTDSNIPLLLEGLKSVAERDEAMGVNLLFWGWPGTGKTEFAKHLASQVGKELMVRRMSDLQSKFVGETEKNIARTFRTAEESGAILFLDEADSLFINRQTAQRSWETGQTNEILTQMENFTGILICCTNLLENLDQAVMRRFAFKIKFKPLTDEGKLSLYRNYFSFVRGSLSSQQESRIARLRNLCPGDIKAVWQRLRILGGTALHDTVIEELEREISYKAGQSKMAIGF